MVLADSVERLYVQERNKKMEIKGADEHQANCSETISEQMASSVASSVLVSSWGGWGRGRRAHKRQGYR